jgi:low affinity Fe/Cu permease
MELDLQVNVLTIVCLLIMFLGLQMQITRITRKLDELLRRK